MSEDVIAWGMIDAAVYSAILDLVFVVYKKEHVDDCIGIAQAIYWEGFSNAECFNIV